MKRCIKAVVALLIFVWSGTGYARIININVLNDARVADQTGGGEGTIVSGQDGTTLHVGDNTNNVELSLVYTVELPVLNAGEQIDTAKMAVYFQRINSSSAGAMPNVQFDLFFKNTGAIETNDYQTAAVASLADFVTPASAGNTIYTWTNEAIAGAFAGVYNNGGVPAFSHAVFRLRCQSINSELLTNGVIDAYIFVTRENASLQQRPKLTLTTKKAPAVHGFFFRMSAPPADSLSLPVASEKMVIAHTMTGVFPGLIRTITVDAFMPDGEYGKVGGINLVLPMDAWRQAELPSNSVSVNVSSGMFDDMLEREMRAAKLLGIDGFQFFFPTTGPENSNWANEFERFRSIICRFFKVAEERDVDFKLTLCLSTPSIAGTTETRADVMSERIQAVLDETYHSPKWLRTPDGRLLIFTFSPETLTESVTEPAYMFTSVAEIPAKLNDIENAYRRLTERLDLPEGIAFVYHIRGWEYAELHLDRNAQSTDFEIYKQYVNGILERFPAVCGWVDLDSPGADLGWNYIIEACRQRNRSYVQSVFNEFTMSKSRAKKGGARIGTDISSIDSDADLFRYYVGTGLSSTYRRLLNRAIDSDSSLISYCTWNDYEEGHHLAPEINHNFGFSALLRYYKSLWKNETPATNENLIVFYKKHPSTVTGSLFHIENRWPHWMVGSNRWDELTLLDDKIEVVTILNEPAELWFRGTLISNVTAGISSFDFPLTAGEITAEIKRAGATIMKITPPEWVTDAPYRTDRITYTWSYDHETIRSQIFGDYPTHPLLSEYAETNGIPNWQTIYNFQ